MLGIQALGKAHQRVATLITAHHRHLPPTHADTDISHRAEAVFAWLEFIAPLTPGSAMGLGTIPDCTGLDHDDFIDPGAEIEISIERLGSLQCRFAEPTGKLLPSRWPLRPALQKFHGA